MTFFFVLGSFLTWAKGSHLAHFFGYLLGTNLNPAKGSTGK